MTGASHNCPESGSGCFVLMHGKADLNITGKYVYDGDKTGLNQPLSGVGERLSPVFYVRFK